MANKTKEELKQEIKRQQIDKFIKAYDEASQALAEKYGYQMVPYLDSSNPFIGTVPRLYPHKVTLKLDEKTDTPAD